VVSGESLILQGLESKRGSPPKVIPACSESINERYLNFIGRVDFGRPHRYLHPDVGIPCQIKG